MKIKSTCKKALLFTVVALFATLTLQAQRPSDELVAYMDYLAPQRALAYKYFYDKSYPEANEAFSDIVKKAREIPVAEQRYLRSVYSDAYYGVARCYLLVDDLDNTYRILDSAISYSYSDYTEIKNNKEFDKIRNEERFKTAYAKICDLGDYVSILKKTAPYAQDSNPDLPSFVYEDVAESAELQQIRDYFNLDSIAGNGSDSERIIKLLNWGHDAVLHDGNSSPQIDRTAISIYEHVKKTGQGVNCRNLSIFLNECYLAVGIKARYVTCLPKDTLDSECHVINQAYADDLKKWIWVDPTNNAYLKDADGNLLNIAEVRQGIIDDVPIFLNEDANWNNKSEVTKEGYIDGYMSKNLYWFQCPRVYKTKGDLDFTTDVPSICLFPRGEENTVLSRGYKTNDENYFWEID